MMGPQSNPIAAFREDWAKAKEGKDPNAPFCTLTTVVVGSAPPAPTARIVGLRQVTQDDGFLLFINSTSPKWSQLQANSHYELLVFWPTIMIQYRIKGSRFTMLNREEMQEFAKNRPHTPQLLSHYYSIHESQSSELASRQTDFVDKMKLLNDEYPPGEKVPASQEDVGLVLIPDTIEEWRGSVSDRLHHRYRHDLTKEGTWKATPLVP